MYLSGNNNAEASQTIKFCFEAMDSDQDGFVNKSDFRLLFGKIAGSKWSSVALIFDKIDSEKLGKISAKQFIGYLKENAEHCLIFKALALAMIQKKTLSEIRMSNINNQSANLGGYIIDFLKNRESKEKK